jgi:hypothetical protein
MLDVRYVALRHSRAGLVLGCPHPNGGVANLATATIRSSNLDLLGLRRALWHVGNVGRYSFRTDGGISVGETPNCTVGSRIVDRWLGPRRPLFGWLDPEDHDGERDSMGRATIARRSAEFPRGQDAPGTAVGAFSGVTGAGGLNHTKYFSLLYAFPALPQGEAFGARTKATVASRHGSKVRV